MKQNTDYATASRIHPMTFTPAKFDSRTCPNVSPLRYAVRRTTSSNRVCTLQISATCQILASAGIKEGDGVRLDFNRSAGFGRILAVQNAPRSFRGKGRKAASLVASWPFNGEIAERFPQPSQTSEKGSGTVALAVEETSRSEGLIFTLPASPL